MDGLKSINDTHGHNYGSEAIKTLARIMKEYSRESDILCRLGGDEFLVFVSGDYLPLITRIKAEINRFNTGRYLPFDIGFSFGKRQIKL
jgi:diguanylate cyclase (GGDEF)-like protein